MQLHNNNNNSNEPAENFIQIKRDQEKESPEEANVELNTHELDFYVWTLPQAKPNTILCNI